MSDTPITDAARWRAVKADTDIGMADEVIASMESLELSHNALIAKLEMLYADWSSTDYGMYANESDTAKEIALKTAAEELRRIIQEAKQ